MSGSDRGTIFQPGEGFVDRFSGVRCNILQWLGSGAQGEVYKVEFGGKIYALKWFHSEYLHRDQRLPERLRMAIQTGAPSDRFLWPLLSLGKKELKTFGYIMPLRDSRFCSLLLLMGRNVKTAFAALATAGANLSHGYLQLHAKGLCYRDISWNNVFFDPQMGEIQICDNDNIDLEGKPGLIVGTPKFMAPEIVMGKAQPSIHTDLFSLAILLFLLLTISHPFDGAKEAAIHCFDVSAMRRLYGENPVFVFDPTDQSNRPDPYANASVFWDLYPQFIKDLFIQTFTTGIRDTKNGRVRESVWREAMMQLRDSITLCAKCGAQNFVRNLPANSLEFHQECWSCKAGLVVPLQLKVGKKIIVARPQHILSDYHLISDGAIDPWQRKGMFVPHPQKPEVLGLQNLTQTAWSAKMPDGSDKEIPPGKTIALRSGAVLHFGKIDGEVLG